MKKAFITIIAVTFIAAAGVPVFAQYGDQEWQGAPPPSYVQRNAQAGPYVGAEPQNESAVAEQQPAVARVSFIRGDVSIQRADSNDWVAATLNTPAAQGDRISTGPNGRAEIQLDYANILRMAGNATVTVASLARSAIQVQVGEGLVSYSVLPNAEAAAEIDTPNVSVRPVQGEGEYRIDVSSNSDTRVTARRGAAAIATPQGSTRVADGQMIEIQGVDNPQYQTSQAYRTDDWDHWVSERDRRITRADSWRHTDRYYTGSEDLDSYGQWQNVPDYGQVWEPDVARDWSPYSSGSWVWEPYYGWTWVSYEPWGWAPYHYGRWFVYGGNWVWWPGPVAVNPAYYPIWAPAYVSFFGFGGGFGVSFNVGGFGLFGWLPCGPGDWFHPWWGRWGGRFETFGFREFGRGDFHGGFRPLVSSIHGFHGREFSNILEAATNARVRAGLTTTEANRFGREGVNGHGRAISESEFRQASFITGRNPATATRASYTASNHPANPSTIRSGTPGSQRFFSPGRSNSYRGAMAGGQLNTRASNGSPSRVRPGPGLNRPAGTASGGSAPMSLNRSGNMNEPQNNSRGQSSGASRPGWHASTPPSGTTNRAGGSTVKQSRNPRSVTPPSSGARVQQPTGPSRNFAPRSANNSPRGFAPPNSTQRAPQSAAPNRSFAPPAGNPSPRTFSPSNNNSRGAVPNYSRPPLNMHQPVVTPRGGGYPSGRGGSRGYGPPSAGSHGGGSHTTPLSGSHSGGGGSRGGGGHHR